MNKLTIFLFIFYLTVVGCSSKNELTHDEAIRLIKKGKNYPKVLHFDLYCGDPKYAKKVIDVGLEAQDFVTVQRTQKLGEVGNPLIHFTDKAKPYLLSTPPSYQSSNIQKVKLADEDLVEVTGINTGTSGKDAVVEYTTSYKNVSPFSVLAGTDFKQQTSRKANFSLYEDGWKLER